MAQVLKKIPVNKEEAGATGETGGTRVTGGTRIPVFPVLPVFLVFLVFPVLPVFPLGRPSRLFFFATFGGKSGAKATHHISGGGESRKA